MTWLLSFRMLADVTQIFSLKIGMTSIWEDGKGSEDRELHILNKEKH